LNKTKKRTKKLKAPQTGRGRGHSPQKEGVIVKRGKPRAVRRVHKREAVFFPEGGMADRQDRKDSQVFSSHQGARRENTPEKKVVQTSGRPDFGGPTKGGNRGSPVATENKR